MNSHKNARLGFAGRVRLVERVLRDGERVVVVAGTMGVSRQTVYKWVARFRGEGLAGLHERSSRPHRSPRRLAVRWMRRIERLRRRRWTSPRIARELALPLSTVVVIVRRLGLPRLRCLEPPVPIVRYERERPGELLHVDTKKLARITRVGHRITADRATRVRGRGWEHVYVAVDDASRAAYCELLAREDGPTAAGFLRRAAAWLAQRGIRLERVMTDNAGAWRATASQHALAELGVRHLRTRPYTPQTNGKAERFIQTVLREWAYARAYRTSTARAAALPGFVRYYNAERPHWALGMQPPLTRLAV
ncbi:MAG TPA: IS481 family transposase [Gemmatimonadales bacterium]|nr:IS481 family transposase [Gemmatimonadales bacterium]